MDPEAMADAAMRRARAGLAQQCARAGTPMAADADMGTLASCGRDMQAIAEASLVRARAAIAASPGLTPEQRAQALGGIDAALAHRD